MFVGYFPTLFIQKQSLPFLAITKRKEKNHSVERCGDTIENGKTDNNVRDLQEVQVEYRYIGILEILEKHLIAFTTLYYIKI